MDLKQSIEIALSGKGKFAVNNRINSVVNGLKKDYRYTDDVLFDFIVHYFRKKNLVFKYDKEKVTLDKYTIIEASRQRVVYNWLQYFSKESLTQEFIENGFHVEALYADVAGSPLTPVSKEIAVVARPL